MSASGQQRNIIIVDDEWESAIIKAVRRRLEDEGWNTVVVEPEGQGSPGQEFELAALYAIEEGHPDGVLLDVRFGEHRDDQFSGLEILRSIVGHYPKLPILMFTQYVQGLEHSSGARGGARVRVGSLVD